MLWFLCDNLNSLASYRSKLVSGWENELALFIEITLGTILNSSNCGTGVSTNAFFLMNLLQYKIILSLGVRYFATFCRHSHLAETESCRLVIFFLLLRWIWISFFWMRMIFCSWSDQKGGSSGSSVDHPSALTLSGPFKMLSSQKGLELIEYPVGSAPQQPSRVWIFSAKMLWGIGSCVREKTGYEQLAPSGGSLSKVSLHAATFRILHLLGHSPRDRVFSAAVRALHRVIVWTVNTIDSVKFACLDLKCFSTLLENSIC